MQLPLYTEAQAQIHDGKGRSLLRDSRSRASRDTAMEETCRPDFQHAIVWSVMELIADAHSEVLQEAGVCFHSGYS